MPTVKIHYDSGAQAVLYDPATQKILAELGATGACCVSGFCSIQTEMDCIGFFGLYLGDGTNCDSFPCANLGTCCWDDGTGLVDHCTVELHDACLAHPFHIFFADDYTCELCYGCCCPDGDCFSCPGGYLSVGIDCTSIGGCFRGLHSTCS